MGPWSVGCCALVSSFTVWCVFVIILQICHQGAEVISLFSLAPLTRVPSSSSSSSSVVFRSGTINSHAFELAEKQSRGSGPGYRRGLFAFIVTLYIFLSHLLETAFVSLWCQAKTHQKVPDRSFTTLLRSTHAATNTTGQTTTLDPQCPHVLGIVISVPGYNPSST